MRAWTPAGRSAQPWTFPDWVSPAAAIALPSVAIVAAAHLAGSPSPGALAAVAGGAVVLTLLAASDAATRTVPNAVVLPAILMALAAAAVHGSVSLVSSVVGAIAAGGPYALMYYAPPLLRGRPTRNAREDQGETIVVAGVAGMVAVLGIGLAHADVPPAAAVAAALVAGTSFFLLGGRGERDAHDFRPAGQSGLGGGDVKLAVLLGAVAGIPTVGAALTLAIVGGAAAAGAVFVLRRGGWFPYGPFLAAGTAAALIMRAV